MNADAERELATELAQLVVEQVAPEELVIFGETADQYFDDPKAVLAPRNREEAVGFGLDIAMVTPVVLAAVTPVIGLLASTVADAVRDEARPAVARLVRRLFRRSDEAADVPAGVPPVSADVALRIRETVHERAKSLGLDDERATLLADSVVGSLVVA